MSHIIDFDGEHLPEELRSLPPGRYVVEPLDEDVALTPDEEESIRQALASLERGEGESLEVVRARILGSSSR